MKTKHANKISEKGIVTIFAIGFIGLLTMLSMFFMTNSILERKTSQNYNALQTARMAAKSALTRSIATLNLYADDNTKDINNIYSYNSSTSESVRSENLKILLETVVSGITYYDSRKYNPNEGPHWQYVLGSTKDIDDPNSDSPIVARFAYIVIAEHGKLDLSACLDSGLNSTVSSPAASEISGNVSGGTNTAYVGRDGFERTSLKPNPDIYTGSNKYITGRSGRNVNEIFLMSIGNWMLENYAEKLSTKNASPSGELNAGATWLDFDSIFNTLSISDSDIKDSFRTCFVLNNPEDVEAYWIDESKDKMINVKEIYHRFNISRTNWNDLTVDSLISDPKLVYPTGQKTSLSSSSDENIYSLPWLKNWNHNGDFLDTETCQKQIAANLIDYNDTDDSATVDNIDAPTFVGLENCPYINEIKLVISGKAEEINPAFSGEPGLSDYECTMNIMSSSIELVNMYSNNVDSAKAELTVSGEYNWAPNNPTPSVFLDKKIIFNNISTASNSYSASNYSTKINIMPDEDSKNEDEASGLSRSITEFKITKLEVKLTDAIGNNLYDFAYVDTGYLNETISSDGTVDTIYIDYQIADPRQNLSSWEWEEHKDVTNTDTGTIGTKNYSFIHPSGGIDADSEPNATEPWNISTAYVRNAPMLSPWELGFIHRGKKWQTLNLKKYKSFSNPTQLPDKTDGGGEYSDGDVNILDQIKMTAKPQVKGLVNLNSGIKPVLKALFEKIRVGSDVGSSEGPGALTSGSTSVTSSIAQSLADKVSDNNGSIGGSEFYSRAQILRETNGVPELWNIFSIQNTDAKQEEIIGKFINLTKATTTANFYTVIAIAQSINDIEDPGTYNTNEDEILTNQKILVRIERVPDANGDKFYIRRFLYIDEIK